MTTSAPRALRLAHRGDWRHAPENTLPAMRAALQVPTCVGLEFDVQLSRDGVPILLHDDTLERVQGRPERPQDLTADELAALGVPRLADVLAASPADAFLDIELKGDPGDAINAIVDDLERARGQGLEHAVVSSFEPAGLARLGELRPGWPRWLNAVDLERATIELARSLGCTGISADWRAITPATARAVRDAGLDLAAWTVRRRATARRLERLGVVALCVEGPALDG